MSLWDGRARFEVSSADLDATPVWIDLTSRVLDAVQDVEVGLGRQTDQDLAEPGRMTLVLNNDDGALTSGNPSSPYPWWRTFRLARLRETVGPRQFWTYCGYLQIADQIEVTEDTESYVYVTCVDLLGRLAVAEPFLGTLAEHVRVNGGSMAAWWPLNDGFGAAQVDELVAGRRLIPEPRVQSATPSVGSVSNLLTFGGRAGPVGDDCTYVQFNNVDLGYRYRLVNRAITGVSVTSASVLTLSAWIYIPTSATPVAEIIVHDAGSASVVLDLDVTAGTWQLFALNAGSSTTVIGPAPATDKWQLITARIACAAGGAVELWVDQVAPVTGTLAAATTGNIEEIVFDGAPAGGSMAQAQLYLGDANSFTHTMHLAQYQMGLTGLDRQTTGERVNTILDYAGVPSAGRRIDAGVSVMQQAGLAGKTPLDCLREAERTERGRLRIEPSDGSAGTVVFDGRDRLYNI